MEGKKRTKSIFNYLHNMQTPFNGDIGDELSNMVMIRLRLLTIFFSCAVGRPEALVPAQPTGASSHTCRYKGGGFCPKY